MLPQHLQALSPQVTSLLLLKTRNVFSHFFVVSSFRDELEVFQDISNGDNIIEGDIELTPEEAKLFNETGSLEGLVNSQAWMKGIRKWPREIKYQVSTELGKNTF